MWIAPNGKVLILSGVPVDNSYTDVPWFESKGAQSSYFQGFLLSGQSYSKVGFMRTNTKLPATSQGNTSTPRDECTIRVPTNASNLYTANYLMFQNTAYSDKWFYAFVKRVNPLSDNVTEIEYELDEIQTWMFDFEIGACPMEREHIPVSQDQIGANVEAEPISPNLTSTALIKLFGESETNRKICFLAASDPDGKTITLPAHGASFLLPRLTVRQEFDYEVQTDLIAKWIDSYAGAGNLNAIIECYCYTDLPALSEFTVPQANLINTAFRYGASDGAVASNYKPKNKKLYTSPYCMLKIFAPDNSSGDYYPELFVNGEDYKFSFNKVNRDGDYLLTPLNYNLNRNTVNGDWTGAFTFSTRFYIPWGGTQYSAIMSAAMTKAELGALASTITGAISGGAMGGVPGAIAGGAVGLISGGINVTATEKSKALALNKTVSQPAVASDNLNGAAISVNYSNVRLCVESVLGEDAERYDSFFTYYGYTVDSTKIPNGINNNKRPVFNFIKTKQTIFKSCSCPVESAQKIKECFQNGIRLWHDTSKIGSLVTPEENYG